MLKKNISQMRGVLQIVHHASHASYLSRHPAIPDAVNARQLAFDILSV